MPVCSTAQWSDMSAADQTPVGSKTALLVETPPASSEADEQAEDADSDLDEDIEAPASPTSTRKRRTRRRRRHGKKAGASTTSTASTASGGNIPSEDDEGGIAAQSPENRGVVTWGDLGLGLSIGSKGEGSSQPNRPAMARCEISGPPPPPINPPEILGDASERMVPPSPMGRQPGGHWFGVRDTGISMPPAHPAWGTRWNELGRPTIQVQQVQPSPLWGMSPGTPMGAPMGTPMGTPMGVASECLPMPSYASFPCSPTGAASAPAAPAPTPSGSGSAVPSWLRGTDMPIGGEDLAERLRAVAPDAYED